MFEIGWTEILFVGIIAIFVLKPRDYPEAMRSIGSFFAKARQMAGEFQSQFDQAMRDAKLDDVKKTIDELRDMRSAGPMSVLRETATKFADEADGIKRDIEGKPRLEPPPAPAPATDPPTAPPLLPAADPLLAALPPPPATSPPLDLAPPTPVPAEGPRAAPPLTSPDRAA